MSEKLSEIVGSGRRIDSGSRTILLEEDLRDIRLDRLDWRGVKEKHETWQGKFLFNLLEKTFELEGIFLLPRGYETALEVFEEFMEKEPKKTTEKLKPNDYFTSFPYYHPFPLLSIGTDCKRESRELISSLLLCAVNPPLSKPWYKRNQISSYRLARGWNDGLVLFPADLLHSSPLSEVYVESDHRVILDSTEENYQVILDDDGRLMRNFVINIPLVLSEASRGIIAHENMSLRFYYYFKEGCITSPTGKKRKLPHYAFNF